MTRNVFNNKYFDWMYKRVCGDTNASRLSYRKLLEHLHTIEFTYILVMDSNRAEDGTDLRYRFAYENNYHGSMVVEYLDDRPCSVLEMMVALANRCEEDIMDDPEMGNRTGQWFWDMIVSLGLYEMNDWNFDPDYVDEVINIFLNREYKYNGEGGLFTVRNCKQDMRTVEIWYQMCWHLDEI